MEITEKQDLYSAWPSIIDGTIISSISVIEGSIACNMRGSRGFGYDVLFIPEGYKKLSLSLAKEQKIRFLKAKKALDGLRLKIMDFLSSK